MIGGKKVIIQDKGSQALVKVGGGFLALDKFMLKNYQELSRKLMYEMNTSGMTLSEIMEIKRHRMLQSFAKDFSDAELLIKIEKTPQSLQV